MSENQSEFYVFLPSHAPSFTDHVNNSSDYITRMHCPLDLQGDWEVALTQLTIPPLDQVTWDYLDIYFNIVKPTYVGTKAKKILRSIRKTTKQDEYLEFDELRYVPIDYNYTSDLHIRLLNSNGVLADGFNFCNVGLHFRKKV